MTVPQIHRCYCRHVDGRVVLRNLEGDDPFNVTVDKADFDAFCAENPQVEVIPDPEGGQDTGNG